MTGAAPRLDVTVADGVLRVTIDRAAKRNALSRSLLAELGATFARFAETPGLRVAVLTGAGERSFAAGGDLEDLAQVVGEAAARAMASDAKAALGAIRAFPLPVVAALNGDALGGGAELALACDMRVAAAHARIGFIQGRLAISSAWGGGVDLMRLAGAARGLRLLARSEVLSAQEALDMGLVDTVARTDQSLASAVDDFIAPMLAQAPQVLRAFKALVREHRLAGRAPFDAIETDHFARTWAHPDHDAAVQRVLDRMVTKT